MNHEFDMTCWCGPVEETEFCEDGHPNHLIYHHDEDGMPLFYLLPGDDTPFCADCGEVMPEFFPEPPWIWRSRIFVSLMQDEEFAVGIQARREAPGLFEIEVGLGRRSLHILISGARRDRSPAETASQMAPHMLAEIEQHLKSHG